MFHWLNLCKKRLVLSLLLGAVGALFHCTIVLEEPEKIESEIVEVLREGSFSGSANFTVTGRVQIIRLVDENGASIDDNLYLEFSPNFKIDAPVSSQIKELTIYLSKATLLQSEIELDRVSLASLVGYQRYAITDGQAIENINSYSFILLYSDTMNLTIGSAGTKAPGQPQPEKVEVLRDGSFSGSGNFTVTGRVQILRLIDENGDSIDGNLYLEFSPNFNIDASANNQIEEVTIYLSQATLLQSEVELVTVPLASLVGYQRFSIGDQQVIQNINSYSFILLYSDTMNLTIGSAKTRPPGQPERVEVLRDGSFSGSANFTVTGRIQIIRRIDENGASIDDNLYLEFSPDFEIDAPASSQVEEMTIYLSQATLLQSEVELVTVPLASLVGYQRYAITNQQAIENINSYSHVLLYSDTMSLTIGSAETTLEQPGKMEVLRDGSFSGSGNFTITGSIKIIRFIDENGASIDDNLYLEFSPDFEIDAPASSQVNELTIYLSQATLLQSEVKLVTVPLASLVGYQRYAIGDQQVIQNINSYSFILLYSDTMSLTIGSAKTGTPGQSERVEILREGSFSGSANFTIIGSIQIIQLVDENGASIDDNLYLEFSPDFEIDAPASSQVNELTIYLSQAAVFQSEIELVTVPLASLVGYQRFSIGDQQVIQGINSYSHVLLYSGTNLAIGSAETMTPGEPPDPPPTGDTVLYSGTFRPLSSSYRLSGSVQIIQAVDGSRKVQFSDDFSVSSGPGLYVYLTMQDGRPTGSDLELGSLVSTSGAQSYSIPDGTNLFSFSYVLIHCRPFNVPFGNAPLQAADPPNPPPTEDTVLYSGTFRPLSRSYRLSGSVEILQAANGSLRAQFSDDFSVSSGPGLYVYLTMQDGRPTGSDLELGSLASTSGAQSYSIPDGTNLFSFSYVLIHCRPFNVPFGNAPLQAADLSFDRDIPTGEF